MFNFINKHKTFFYLISFFILWAILMGTIHPERIVDFIGIENAYIVVFFLAFFGGLSTFTSAPLFASIITFVAGGANPILIIILGGFGSFFSDTAYYFIAKYGVKFFKKRDSNTIEKISKKIHTIPDGAVFTGSFVWIGLTPLPNDILMFALALSNFEYKKIFPIILLGDFIFVSFLAYLGKFIF